MEYDYLIVGSGLFGSICARELTDKGYKCLVIDSRNHIGGNCYTENKDGINIHKYGPHIFHTNDDNLWKYINTYTKFNNFTYRPRVNYKNKIYSFPINLLTLYQVFDVKTPTEAISKLENLRQKIDNPRNLEEYVLSQVGEDIYNIFIKGYTEKQWKLKGSELPASIIKRIPIRTNFDDNYFFDKYQGIPIGGYTQIFEKLLNGIEIKLNTDFFQNREYFENISNKIVYTGRIDEYFNYEFGELNYRTLDFQTERLEIPDYQGVSVINYTDYNVPYTRIIEHKHFEFGNQNFTYITKEYPIDWSENKIPYYPINTDDNMKIYNKYKEKSKILENKLIFGGRLGSYQYYDMHQIIGQALKTVKTEIEKYN
jgi:UDP-galactopyranose mutase